MKYSFVGFGNIAKAIYQGLKNDPELSFAYIDKEKKAEAIEVYEDLGKMVADSDVIWLCVKPQNLTEVLEAMKNISLQDKAIVSPVAGKSISFIQDYLGADTTIVRIMPNLAIAYQRSVTAYCTNNEGSLLAKKIKYDLNKLGEVVELSEKDFDIFTAVFGSGPAFLLEILKVFKNKIAEMGILEERSNSLLIALALGTIAYFEENKNEKNIDELIKKITSKGGTTEAGLKYFSDQKISELMAGVLASAEKRSKEISG